MTKNTRRSLDTTEANKLFAHAKKKILGPGLRERIKKEAEKPDDYAGTDGIRFDPNWQDDVINPTPEIRQK